MPAVECRNRCIELPARVRRCVLSQFGSHPGCRYVRGLPRAPYLRDKEGESAVQLTGFWRSDKAAIALISICVLTLAACSSVNPADTIAPSPTDPTVSVVPSSASPAPSATKTPRPTARPCVAGDTRPKCQTPAPSQATTEPTVSPTPGPTTTSSPTPTTASTGTSTGSKITSTGFGVAPLDLDFGNVVLGATGTVPIVITNLTAAPLTPNYAGGAPNDPTYFGGSQNCAGVELASNGSCQFTYTFSPTAQGPFTSATTIDIDGDSVSITMKGCGIVMGGSC